MTEQRFFCTVCGKCCQGRVPLTLDDAFANSSLFPLAMLWTPVRQASRSFSLTAQLGTTVMLRTRKPVAVLISPTAYIPPSFSCPALTAENLCNIHAHKPLRCRTMPFFPYREESDQVDMLVPRKGWTCDISESAPVVYRDKTIVERADFDGERSKLLAQAPILRTYAEALLKQVPSLLDQLTKAAQNPAAGYVVLNFSSFLRVSKTHDIIEFAKVQHPVLADFERRTLGNPEMSAYHNYYRDAASELEWFAKRSDR
jgi:Fe-S-cluster containining protein